MSRATSSYVVEANVAPTSKYNLVVDRSDSLDVTVDEVGTSSSDLQARLAEQRNDSQVSHMSRIRRVFDEPARRVRRLRPSA